VWLTRVEPGLLAALPERWPSWHIEFWRDSYEEHLLRCNGAVTVPELDLVAGLDEVESWLRKRIFQSFEESPAGKILELAQMLSPIAPGMQISDSALEHRPSSPPQTSGPQWSTRSREFALDSSAEVLISCDIRRSRERYFDS